MSDKKTYYTFICILVLAIVVVKFSHTIFPVMDDDEYFVDKNGLVHGNNCPYNKVPWFTSKHSKYDFILKKDQEICRECLLFEEDKLLELHIINIDEEILRLKRLGASEECINNRIEQYEDIK